MILSDLSTIAKRYHNIGRMLLSEEALNDDA